MEKHLHMTKVKLASTNNITGLTIWKINEEDSNGFDANNPPIMPAYLLHYYQICQSRY